MGVACCPLEVTNIICASAGSHRGRPPRVSARGHGAAARSGIPPPAGEQTSENQPVSPEPEPAGRQVNLQITWVLITHGTKATCSFQTLGEQLLPKVPHAHLLPSCPGSQSQSQERRPDHEEMSPRPLQVSEAILEEQHQKHPSCVCVHVCVLRHPGFICLLVCFAVVLDSGGTWSIAKGPGALWVLFLAYFGDFSIFVESFL